MVAVRNAGNLGSPAVAVMSSESVANTMHIAQSAKTQEKGARHLSNAVTPGGRSSSTRYDRRASSIIASVFVSG